jgi:predicted phage terminase large subunit-like protein
LAKIVFRESDFILVVSDTETQAVFFLQDLKKELTENEDLRKMFGVGELVKDTDSDFIIQFDDGKKCRVIAKGSGQSLRGVKWDGKRPNLIVCDDLENDEIVMNKERRDKFRRWVSGTLIPCLSKDGIIRVVGTILHADSYLERLMPKEHRKDVLVEDLKVSYLPNAKAVWKAAKYKAHDRKMTKALWPENKPIAWLMEERQTYIEQGMTDVWSQEMLNVPLDEENAPFRRGDFKEMAPEDLNHNWNYYVACDLALSLEQSRDYTCFVVGAVDETGKLYIPHIIHTRMQSDEIEETIFELAKTYDPELFFFEKGQAWLSVEPHVVRGMLERNAFFSYELFPSITDKVSRASAIRSRMRVGAVKFDKSSDWWPDFEDECLKFPRGAHDDQVDALSLLGRGLKKFIEAPTNQEIAEEAEEEMKFTSGFYEAGISEHTGY